MILTCYIFCNVFTCDGRERFDYRQHDFPQKLHARVHKLMDVPLQVTPSRLAIANQNDAEDGHRADGQRHCPKPSAGQFGRVWRNRILQAELSLQEAERVVDDFVDLLVAQVPVFPEVPQLLDFLEVATEHDSRF